MTITNTVKHLPSGKPGLNIIANLDEVAILRGLVVNALRHMPDVGETTSTRQRLKAMSRALHRVYTSVSFTESTVQATPEQVSKIVAMIRDCKGNDWKASTFVGEQCGKNWAKKYMEARARETDPAVQSIHRHHEAQGQDGNWNANWYMLGLYNGLELAVATLESREPRYRDRPKTGWLDDAPIKGPDTLVAYADPKPAVDPLTAEKMAKPPVTGPKYGGTPIIYKKPVLPITDQRTLMECLDRMPGEFTFKYFYDKVFKTAEAYIDRQRGSGVDVESNLRDECDAFILDLPRNVFDVDGVFQTVKRKGYVAVTDPKSITNPDYVSHTAKPAAAPNTPEEVPVEPPKPAAHRTTLFEVYDKMDSTFTFADIRIKARHYGHDRVKVSAFVSLMCRFGSLRLEQSSIPGDEAYKYTKLSSVTSPDMRHLASLIA